jgi:hypothetical protein
MYVSEMFDVRFLMVERCSVLIGVGVSAVTVGILLIVGESLGRAVLCRWPVYDVE